MVESPAAFPSSIAADTPCVRCGYNLRGLSPEGRCPECGSPVLHSIRGDLLKFADPAWLRRILFGTSFKLWNIALTILVSLGAGALALMGTMPRAFAMAAALVAGALGLLATFAITTQEPRIALQEDPLTLRRAIRAAAAVSFGGAALQAVPIGPAWTLAGHYLGQALGLFGWVVAFGELIYYRRFARRIPDTRLATSTTRLMWLSVVTGVLATAAAVGAMIFAARLFGVGVGMAGGAALPGSAGGAGVGAGGAAPIAAVPMGAPPSGVIVLGCGYGVLAMVNFVWYVGLLVRYRRAIHAALAKAAGPG